MVDAFILVTGPVAIVVALPWVAYGLGVDVGGGWGLDPMFRILLVVALAWPLIGGFYSGLLMARVGAHNGQTWGKQLVGIWVVRTSGEAMSFWNAFARDGVVKWSLFLFGSLLGPFTLGASLLLQALWPLWDKENRALHDMVVSTRVVRAPESVPAASPPASGRRLIRLLGWTGLVAFTVAFIALAAWSVLSRFGGSIDDAKIYIVRADGSGAARLGSEPGLQAAGPTWSPDGGRIAFTRGRRYGDGIFVIDADRSGQRRLTEGGSDPTWSPDGARIAFAGVRRDGIFVVNADGSGERRLTDRGSHPVWSPDGARLAFTEGDDLYIVRPDGSGQARLASGPPLVGRPAWSPDGARLVFAVLSGGQADLHVINADGSGRTRLVSNGLDPAWSPDGTRIAFSRSRKGKQAIYVINADGSGLSRLATGGSQPAWSPDSDRVAFMSSRRGGHGSISVIGADGSNRARLTNLRPRFLSALHTYDEEPSWSPDGKRIAFTKSQRDPSLP